MKLVCEDLQSCYAARTADDVILKGLRLLCSAPGICQGYRCHSQNKKTKSKEVNGYKMENNLKQSVENINKQLLV